MLLLMKIVLLILSLLTDVFGVPIVSETTTDTRDLCNVVVIAHRGASGYVPEHTLGAYALAIMMGADYIEPDLVMTKDGHMISRHDTEISDTTDVSHRPEFASRRTNKTVSGIPIEGWFTEDFTLEEIKTLRVTERAPNVRPSNVRMNGAFTIPTLEEIIELVQSLQISQKRIIGIYPEIKHSTHFKLLGLPMEQKVVDIFKKYGYWRSTDPVYIQSFEITNLKELKNATELKLVQLFDKKEMQPYDQYLLGNNVTYGDMATPEGLREIAQYASGVGPSKNYIITLSEDNRLGSVTSFVTDAHAVGLKVHPYTFRAENNFLPVDFQNELTSKEFGDFGGELRTFLATGIDGVFSEQPDLSVRVRGPCL